MYSLIFVISAKREMSSCIRSIRHTPTWQELTREIKELRSVKLPWNVIFLEILSFFDTSLKILSSLPSPMTSIFHLVVGKVLSASNKIARQYFFSTDPTYTTLRSVLFWSARIPIFFLGFLIEFTPIVKTLNFWLRSCKFAILPNSLFWKP